jgi:cell division protein ZapA
MDNKEDKFLINVQIEGFRMPLNIPRKDEEVYRTAEKTVVNLIQQFQKLYNQRSYEEILKMVAFQLAVSISKNDLSKDLSPLEDKIKELDLELSKVLNQQ